MAERLHGPSGVVVAWKTGLAEAAAAQASKCNRQDIKLRTTKHK